MIHPWRYANGRICGVFVPYLFYYLDLFPDKSFYISSAFCKNKKEYYKLLVDLFENQSWEKWIDFFLNGVSKQLKRYKKINKKIDETLQNLIFEEDVFKHRETRLKYFTPLLENPIYKTQKIIKKYGFNNHFYKINKTLKEEGFIKKDGREQYMHFMLKEYYNFLKEI